VVRHPVRDHPADPVLEVVGSQVHLGVLGSSVGSCLVVGEMEDCLLACSQAEGGDRPQEEFRSMMAGTEVGTACHDLQELLKESVAENAGENAVVEQAGHTRYPSWWGYRSAGPTERRRWKLSRSTYDLLLALLLQHRRVGLPGKPNGGGGGKEPGAPCCNMGFALA
jgi:hypothetical protein